MHAQVAYVDPVNHDFTALHIVETRQKVGQSRLSRTALPHNRHSGSGRNVEGHILQDRSGIVCKSHVLIVDVAFKIGQFHRISRVFYGVDGIKNLIDTDHRGQALLNGIHRLRQVLGRINDGVEDDHVVDEFRSLDARSALKYQRSAEPQHYGDSESAEEFAHRVSQRLPTRYIVAYAVEFLVFAVEAVFNLLLGIESLDYAQAAESLFDIRHEESPLVLCLKRLPLQTLTYPAHYKPGERQQNQHEYGELPRHIDHHGQTSDNHNRVFEKHVERRHYRILDFGHIARHTRHDIALTRLGEVGYG